MVPLLEMHTPAIGFLRVETDGLRRSLARSDLSPLGVRNIPQNFRGGYELRAKAHWGANEGAGPGPGGGAGVALAWCVSASTPAFLTSPG